MQASENDESQTTDDEIYNEVLCDDALATTAVMSVPENTVTHSTPAKKPRISTTKPFTNPIHKWFIDDDNHSKCTICSVRMAGKHATNLKRHLAKHPQEHKMYVIEMSKASAEAAKKETLFKKNETGPSSNQPISDCFRRIAERKDGWRKGSAAYNKAVRSIGIAFVANSLPYRLIEDPFMKQMFTTISDRRLIDLPRRQELAAQIGCLTEELKSSIKSSLETAKYVSLTVDLWSRPGYSSAMMGITCHYFDRKLNQNTHALLACRTIKQPHTGGNIYDLYNTVRSDWELDESRILRIVTDNGSNVVNAFKECLFTLFEESIIGEPSPVIPRASDFDNNFDESFDEDEENEVAHFDQSEADVDSYFYRKKRISCFAHNMMLAVRKAVDYSAEVKNAKRKAQSLIAQMSKSPKAIETLRASTGGIGLVKPVLTRWIYWYYVFDRLLKIKRNVCDVCEELNIIHNLGPIDWKLLAQVKDILAPFAAAVTRLEGESYATTSEIYPILFSLKAKLRQFEQRATCWSILSVIQKLSAELDHRFKRVLVPMDDHFDPIYVLATILDPRYALILEGELFDVAKNELKLMIGMSGAILNGDDFAVTDSVNNQEDSASIDFFQAVHAKIKEKRRSGSFVSANSPVDQELETYFADVKAVDSAHALDDPFIFWINRAEKLPQMYNVALDVLAIPATTAPVERIFSRASFILSRKRHNLNDKRLEEELFYKVNIEFVG